MQWVRAPALGSLLPIWTQIEFLASGFVLAEDKDIWGIEDIWGVKQWLEKILTHFLSLFLK